MITSGLNTSMMQTLITGSNNSLFTVIRCYLVADNVKMALLSNQLKVNQMTKVTIFKDEYDLLSLQRYPHLGTERVNLVAGFWYTTYFKFI